MGMQTGASGRISAEMNVTPMIDVLLVLIIIFIMIMPVDKGLQTYVPQKPAPNQPAVPEEAIVIQVKGAAPGAQPVLAINHQPVTWSDLQQKLKTVFAARTQKVAFVQGDDSVEFQNIAAVIDAAHTAGVEKIGLMSQDAAKN
jgi:biopolymer transport protein ExbD